MKRYCSILLLGFLFSCRMNTEKFEVTIEKMQLLDSVPSGSGIAVIDDVIYIIGDDATALYKLSVTNGGHEAIRITNTDSSVYRIAKPIKHDLECLAVVTIDQQQYLVAFGSGSVSPYRDSLLVISVADPHRQQWISAATLYRQLRSVSKTKELNLEGAVTSKNVLYLFNRSGNEVFEIDLAELSGFIQNKGVHPIKKIGCHSITLPANARLSGGCMMGDKILFSASAENTTNAYDDGEIQGSFLGLLDPAANFALSGFTPLSDKTIGLKDKIESIDIAGKFPNEDTRAFAVADNDDGHSRLFELRIVR